MSYEVYKKVKSRKEFFATWEKAHFDALSESLREELYAKYIVKCNVFQRDNFECQNAECQNKTTKLTWHHVRFQKNAGPDTERNGVTLCDSCHKAYHKAKRSLIFANSSKLPAHIRGHTFKLSKPETIDWKVLRKEMKALRRQHRDLAGQEVPSDLLAMIMMFLFEGYYLDKLD